MRGVLAILLFSSIFAGCGAAEPTPGMQTLEALAAGEQAAAARSAAPEAWDAGQRYLELARESAERGEARDTDRFALLGQIELKIAYASHEQSLAQARLDTALNEKDRLVDEKEKLSSLVDRLLVEEERRSLRAHLTLVVEKARLEAAAREEVAEGRLSAEGAARLTVARREVGVEMLERVRVSRHVLGVLVAAGYVDERRLAYLDGELEAAGKELARADLAGLQEHLERAGADARLLVDEVWVGARDARDAAMKELAEELEAKGLEVSEEQPGKVVSFVIARRPGRPRRGWTGALEDLGGVLAARENVAAVVLASAPRKSGQRAREAADALERGGLSGGRVHPVGCGNASPLEALRRGAERIAVLVVPLPKRRP